jgi:hypothetical protein
MRTALCCVLAWTAVGAGQTLAPKPSPIQHVTVSATTSVDSIAPGGSLTLWADVTPKANVHVYASNAHGTTPVSLVLTPHRAVTVGKPKAAPAEMLRTLGAEEPVLAYRKPFRIEQPITIAGSAGSGEPVTIAGVVNYQACDDRVCYPTGAVPVIWTVKVR